ncbi:unnamed protein product [Plutella xylostella]|uniref:(diamondback moth) hypothetical protein n=1 Tax=Plutella xylostella TaxID=51655 RepID=A0A8S4FLM3_PLUXY|nr:unnamed protein product [Plutella xylostella]
MLQLGSLAARKTTQKLAYSRSADYRPLTFRRERAIVPSMCSARPGADLRCFDTLITSLLRNQNVRRGDVGILPVDNVPISCYVVACYPMALLGEPSRPRRSMLRRVIAVLTPSFLPKVACSVCRRSPI